MIRLALVVRPGKRVASLASLGRRPACRRAAVVATISSSVGVDRKKDVDGVSGPGIGGKARRKT